MLERRSIVRWKGEDRVNWTRYGNSKKRRSKRVEDGTMPFLVAVAVAVVAATREDSEKAGDRSPDSNSRGCSDRFEVEDREDNVPWLSGRCVCNRNDSRRFSITKP